MRKYTSIGSWVAFLGLCLLLSSCGSSVPEIYGTWAQDRGGHTETITFSADTVHGVTSGSGPGTVDFSVSEFDETAGHIGLHVVASTGTSASSFPVESDCYMTYSILEDGLYIEIDFSEYPLHPTIGPYLLQ
jgi:hypothetical protein